MFTRSIITSVKTKRFFFSNGEPSGVESTDKPKMSQPSYVQPPIDIGLKSKNEQIANMSRAPKELDNGLALIFPGDSSPKINTQSSYIPGIVLANGKTGAEQTTENLEKSKVEAEAKLTELKELDGDLADNPEVRSEIQRLEAEQKIMNTALNREYEREYDRWEQYDRQRQEDQKMAEAQELENNQKQYQSNSSRDDDESSSIRQSQIEARSERIDAFLGAETESENIIIRETPSGYCLFEENGVMIDDPAWKNFQTRREANRAEIRYRLFSEPPLDNVRNQGPKYINQLLQDNELRSFWNQINPGEPFTAKGLRRLMLVALLKRMNPEKYADMSYDEVIKGQGQSLQNQFQAQFLAHRGNLGLSADESVVNKEIVALTKDRNLWKL